MFSKAELGDEVAALGILAGILRDESGGQVSVNQDWFKNPIADNTPSLENIGTRLDSLVTLLDSLFSKAAAPPKLDHFVGAQWYAIPNPNTGAGTVFHIVAPAAEAQVATDDQIGFGILYSTQVDNLTITPYAYAPLFSYSSAGAHFITASTDNPCQVGVKVTAQGGFKVDGVTYDALNIDASIYLNPDAYNTSPNLLALEFVNLRGTGKPATYTTLAGLLDPDVESWLLEVVVQGSSWLDGYIGTLPVTVGNLLVAAGFLTQDDDGYHLALNGLDGQSPTTIALNFLFGALNALSSSELPYAFVELPGGGLYCERRQNDDDSVDYGIRLALDFALTSGQSADGTPATAIDLTLGTWLLNEQDTNSWYERSANAPADSLPSPGLSIYVLHRDKDFNVSFRPSFALTSVGLNVAGGGDTALFNINGYTVKGVELRAYLDSSDWAYGFACSLDSIGFPLGPNFGAGVQGSQTNPVAQSLLESGASEQSAAAASTGADTGSGGGDQNPVNPTFSASAAYVKGGSFVVQLYDQNGNPATQVLIPLQRSLGPLHCERLGVGWVQDAKGDMLSLLFDGGVTLAGLTVDLVGLSIGVPITTPLEFSQYNLDLNGLGILFSAGAVELSAALVKLPPDPNAKPPRNYTEYDGEAMLKAGTFAITALGSYAYVPDAASGKGYTSLFIFAVLDADLGGPEFFFVTGLAAGFGYNRALILPDQSHVTTFPLVAGANDPATLGAQQQPNGSWAMPDPATALAHLDQYVPPQRGEYWLAAGVRFTSFDLINSTALLIVEFGNELEIAILGLSWMSLPPPPAPGAAAPNIRYAYAELGIEITLLPSQGVFSATAVLTSNSFVIDPACKLTGGFAFYVWFGSNEHAGEFVLTLGGYHPDFTPPSYYPQVPRLGFNWPVTGGVSISGDAYFALTPSAVMAGAGLEVLYADGGLKAWFKAQMDALIEWAPFHYLISISVNVGASYRAHLLFVTTTLKVELSADLKVWGPPMGGKVHINWYVISFTVSFGADQSDKPKPLDWTNNDGTGFAQSLLPSQAAARQAAPQLMAASAAPAVAAAADSVQPSGVYTVTANSGLLSTLTDANGNVVWLVRPNDFVFSVATAIPVTEIDLAPAPGEPPGTQTKFTAQESSPAGDDYYVCIRPMKATLSSSVLTVTLTQDDEHVTYDLAGKFDFDVALARVPAAKWGRPLPAGQDPELNTLLEGRVMGLANITPKSPGLTPAGEAALNIDITTAFTYDIVDEEEGYTPQHLPLQPGESPVGEVPQADDQALQKVQSSLMDKDVVQMRSDILAALQHYGLGPVSNGDLSILAGAPGAYLTGNPLISIPPAELSSPPETVA